MIRRVFLSLILVGCSKPAPVVEVLEAGPAPVASAPPAVDAAPPPRFYHLSTARLEGDVLSECADFSFEIPASSDAGDPTEELRKTRATKGLLVLSKSCDQQFSDRHPLATCQVKKSKGGTAIEVVSSRYRYEDVGLSDAAMKECLGEMQGDWQAVSRDSKEWRDAKLDHLRRSVAH